jgi:hypothetical protein
VPVDAPIPKVIVPMRVTFDPQVPVAVRCTGACLPPAAASRLRFAWTARIVL